jgi:hypothetical protein
MVRKKGISGSKIPNSERCFEEKDDDDEEEPEKNS